MLTYPKDVEKTRPGAPVDEPKQDNGSDDTLKWLDSLEAEVDALLLSDKSAVPSGPSSEAAEASLEDDVQEPAAIATKANISRVPVEFEDLDCRPSAAATRAEYVAELNTMQFFARRRPGVCEDANTEGLVHGEGFSDALPGPVVEPFEQPTNSRAAMRAPSAPASTAALADETGFSKALPGSTSEPCEHPTNSCAAMDALLAPEDRRNVQAAGAPVVRDGSKGSSKAFGMPPIQQHTRALDAGNIDLYDPFIGEKESGLSRPCRLPEGRTDGQRYATSLFVPDQGGGLAAAVSEEGKSRTTALLAILTKRRRCALRRAFTAVADYGMERSISVDMRNFELSDSWAGGQVEAVSAASMEPYCLSGDSDEKRGAEAAR